MSYANLVAHLPFAAGFLVGMGLMLLLVLMVVVAIFWSDNK